MDRRDPKRSRSMTGSGGLAALAARLARLLAEADKRNGNGSSNLVFSPLSIYAALALLAAGARGRTLDEILAVVGAGSRAELDEFISRVAEDALVDRSGSGGPSVAFACGVWSDLTRPLRPAFRDAVVGTHRADARAVDFRNAPEHARAEINAWAALATRNLVDSVLAPGSVDADTLVVLGNAVYFKGKWDQPFDPKHTKNKPFHGLDGAAVAGAVPFMQSRARQFVAVHDGFKVLKLRYKMTRDEPDDTAAGFSYPRIKIDPHGGGFLAWPPLQPPGPQFSLCIFLPDAHDGLWSLVDDMASRPGFLHEHLPASKSRVGEFRVPKFKLSFQDSVAAVLKKLGLKAAFSMKKADLRDMLEDVDDDSSLPTVVSDIIHKSVVEVNEEGTEAAAVSMAGVSVGCARNPPPRPPPVDFVADHPFAYFIVEETSGAVVFAGHVLDPSK